MVLNHPSNGLGKRQINFFRGEWDLLHVILTICFCVFGVVNYPNRILNLIREGLQKFYKGNRNHSV